MSLDEALALMAEIKAVVETTTAKWIENGRRGSLDLPDTKSMWVATTDGQAFSVVYVYWNYSDTDVVIYASVEDWHRDASYLRHVQGLREVYCVCIFAPPVMRCGQKVLAPIDDAQYDYPWICDRCRAQGRTRENYMDRVPILVAYLPRASV